MKLVHYSPHENLTELDPNKMGSSGVGGAQYKRGLPENKSTFYYTEDSAPESLVTQNSPHRYSADATGKSIYDLDTDPDKLVSEMKQRNQNAWNEDLLHSIIKEKGHHGVSWSQSPETRVVQMYQPMKVQPFGKSEELKKGVARRLFGKLNPDKMHGKEQVATWQAGADKVQSVNEEYYDDFSGHSEQEHQKLRSQIPKMVDNARFRAMQKLSNQTISRRHPETGERQFLMFRGVGPDEMKSSLGQHHIEHNEHSSWTPKKSIASGFKTDYSGADKSEKGKTLAAWINESDIHSAPHMYGKLPEYGTDFTLANDHGKNDWYTEHEIIVGPHKSQRATKADVKKYTDIHNPPFPNRYNPKPVSDINQRINLRAEYGGTDEWPAIELFRRPKKLAANELEKAFIYDGWEDSENGAYKPSKGSKKIKSYKLRNGLTHDVFKSPVGKQFHHTISHPTLGHLGTLSTIPSETPGHYTVTSSEVHPNFRGKGIGSSLYSAALLHHKALESDQDVSEEAMSRWMSLGNKKGIQFEDAPFEPADDNNEEAAKPFRARVVDPKLVDYNEHFKPLAGSIRSVPTTKKLAASEAKKINPKDPILGQRPAAEKPATEKWLERLKMHQEKSKLAKGQNGDWKKEGYTFSHQPGKDWGDSKYHTILAHDSNGDVVGHFDFDHLKATPGMEEHVNVRSASVNPTHRRLGLASEAYRQIENITGAKIKASPGNQSDDAKALWAQPKKAFGKSLEKGAHGDWKKEGYSLEFASGNRRTANIGEKKYKTANIHSDHVVFASDKNGKLAKAKKTVYHGTPHVFDKFKVDKQARDLNYGRGVYFAEKPEEAAEFSTMQPYHPDYEAARAKYDKTNESKIHSKMNDVEARKNLRANAITNAAGGSPHVRRAEINIKNPFNPYNIEHAKKVSQAAGYPDDFADFVGHNKEDPHETNFYDMMVDHGLGWNPKKGYSDFYGQKMKYTERAEKLNRAIKVAGFDSIHVPDKGHYVVFNTKQIKDKAFGKSLEKGANGDWKKEGYTVGANKPDKEGIFTVYAKNKKGDVVGTAIFKHGKKYLMPHEPMIEMPAVEVDPPHQRKGLATAMYRHAEKITNKKINRSPIQTEEGEALWSQPRSKRGFGIGKSEPLMKPYQSEAQRKWAHTDAGTKALGGKQAVKEWDSATKGKQLPEKLNKTEYDQEPIKGLTANHSDMLKSLLAKDRGSLKFKNFPKMSTRPDQEIQNIDTTRQQDMFSRKVANSFGRSYGNRDQALMASRAHFGSVSGGKAIADELNRRTKTIDFKPEDFSSAGAVMSDSGGKVSHGYVSNEGDRPESSRRGHEALHHQFNIFDKTVPGGAEKAYRLANDHIHPDVHAILGDYLTKIGYDPTEHHREKVSHLYEMLKDPKTRQAIHGLTGGLNQDIMNKAKQSWKGLTQWAKYLTPKDLAKK